MALQPAPRQEERRTNWPRTLGWNCGLKLRTLTNERSLADECRNTNYAYPLRART